MSALVSLVSVAFAVLPVAAIVVVVLVLVRTRRPGVPASVDRAVAAAGFDPANPPERPVGQWNAEVTPQGRLPLVAGRRGVLRIENGWVGFHHEGADEPTWLVAANRVRAGRNTMLNQSEVWFESEPTGRVNLTVSHEHINRFMDNDFKDLRERRYADEFLWLLAQSGAVVAG